MNDSSHVGKAMQHYYYYYYYYFVFLLSLSLSLSLPLYRRLDSLWVECWLRVREVLGSIPSQGPRHTKDVIKMVPGNSLV